MRQDTLGKKCHRQELWQRDYSTILAAPQSLRYWKQVFMSEQVAPRELRGKSCKQEFHENKDSKKLQEAESIWGGRARMGERRLSVVAKISIQGTPKPAERLEREKCPKSQRRDMSFHVTGSQEDERKVAWCTCAPFVAIVDSRSQSRWLQGDTWPSTRRETETQDGRPWGVADSRSQRD